DLRSRLPHVLAQPRHDRQRSDRAARDRWQRPRLLDPLAQRGFPDLRARVQGEARLLKPRQHRRFLLRAIAVLCGGACLAGTARADVAAYLGRPIGSVRVVIEGRDTTEPLLSDIVGTATGQPLSMVQVRETVAHLFSLGRFEGVSVDASLEGGTVALRYDLIPIHPISRITFAGPLPIAGVDQGALRRAV